MENGQTGDEKDDSQKEKVETILSNGGSSQRTNGKATENGHLKNGSAKLAPAPTLQRTLSSVITKTSFKLAPDMSEDITKSHSRQNSDDNVVTENFDFKLENCLDYMNAGMEAIIEDDVTSRFEAEEIKNWNLLTRTNRRYEFITWRLTVIWVFGFFVRYFLLMPIRVFICFCGVRKNFQLTFDDFVQYCTYFDVSFDLTFKLISRNGLLDGNGIKGDFNTVPTSYDPCILGRRTRLLSLSSFPVLNYVLSLIQRYSLSVTIFTSQQLNNHTRKSRKPVFLPNSSTGTLFCIGVIGCCL